MTRQDIERLLHCARTEGLGAGPNTLAEVCEWALGVDQARSESCPHGMRTADVCYECQAIRAEAAEAKLAKAGKALREIMSGLDSTDEDFPGHIYGICRAALSDEGLKP